MSEEMYGNREPEPCEVVQGEPKRPMNLPDFMKPIIKKAEGVLEDALAHQKGRRRLFERSGFSKAFIEALDKLDHVHQAKDLDEIDSLPYAYEEGTPAPPPSTLSTSSTPSTPATASDVPR